MKRQIIYQLTLILAVIFLQSCSNDQQVLYQNITGKANEVLVVISDDSWNANPGELIRSTLGQSQDALPQSEPVFDVVNIPHNAFKKIFKTSRNIVLTSISSSIESPGITMKDDVWAYPQATIEIKAKDEQQFIDLFNQNRDKIISYFLEAEKKRISGNYKKYYEKSIYNVLNNDFGLTITVPPGFVTARQKPEFIWLKYDTPDIQQGIALYTIPYNSDSTFTLNYLMAKNDSVLEVNIPGPRDGSFMTTEKRLDQVFRITEHNKNYAAEMRGLWRVENDFMGGPYVCLAELDASGQRVVVAFGYIYAPSKDKRNLLQQVEAMIYSMKFNDQAKNDKINSQLKMAN